MSEPRPDRWIRFAASAAALFVLVGLVPVGLAAASRARFGSANPLAGADPPWRWGSEQLGDALSGPLGDDTVVDGIIRVSLCIVWLAVAVIVATTVVEVVHAIRHHGLAFPDVRGIGWAQSIARFVAVGLVAVLPMMTPAASLASALDARAAPTMRFVETAPPRAAATAAGAGVHLGGDVVARAPAPAQAVGSVHVVAAGESIYSIAVSLAGGDSARVLEIADAIIDANLGREMPGGQRFNNPAYVEVGWPLRLPDEVVGARPAVAEPAPGAPAEPGDTPAATTYTVQPGDTLWDIADEQLGDPTAWPEIWERHAGDDMGGGRVFDDPDLILPGWEFELADARPHAEPDADTEEALAASPAVGPGDSPFEVPPTDVVPEPSIAEPGTRSTPLDDLGSDAPTPSVDLTGTGDDEDTVAEGPLPLTPAEPTIVPSSTAGAAPDPEPTVTSTTVPPLDPTGDPSADPATDAPAPEAPSPIRLEHAALLAAGVLALVGVRRRRRLRAAMPRHRVPEPRHDVAYTERTLRTIDAGERVLRADVACRAAARSLIDTGSQIGWVVVSSDGDVDLQLTAPAALPLPWTGEGQVWRLGAEVPIEILGEAARQVGQPCVALIQLGATADGADVLVDLEACGVLAIVARSDQADEVVTAIATALASSLFAEVAHLVAVSLPEPALLNHRSAHRAGTADAAIELACGLVGTTAVNERSSFELRSLRTGGEVWEPAVVLLASSDDGASACRAGGLPSPGHGVAVVVADESRQVAAAARLVARSDGWSFDAFGSSIDLTPVGLSESELVRITELLVDADRELEPIDDLRWSEDLDGDGADDADVAAMVPSAASVPFQPRPHEIVVGLIGAVEVHARSGEAGHFERSKTVELIAWLATHRDRATRTGARTALWDLDVRDATFANVVSEARRALARLVPPPEGEEWVARTLTEQLPIHDLVVTDADLVEERLAHARVQPPSQAIETLRPAVELVRDMPFAGTSYLWPDAEGITSNLVLLAIGATAEFAAHALSLGDTDAVFWATGKGLRVLPGHEELIALRMQAHARAGDLAGVRQEWESYERVLVADAWSDGEPAPKLLALRRELLNPTTS